MTDPTNGRRGLLATLILLCLTIGTTLGYLIATRFTAVEARVDTSEVDIGVLKIKVEILEGGNVRLKVPIDKDRLQRMVMEEIKRQTQETQPVNP
jgi:hypothetical protein